MQSLRADMRPLTLLLRLWLEAVPLPKGEGEIVYLLCYRNGEQQGCPDWFALRRLACFAVDSRVSMVACET